MGPHSTLKITSKIAASAASTANPLFTIINGDLVFLGYEDWLWSAWFDAAKPLTNSSVIMPCLGNHEGYARGFFDRFALLAGP